MAGSRALRGAASGFAFFLGVLEKIGNRVPQPFVLFCWLFAFVAVASTVADLLGASVAVPGKDQVLDVRGVLSLDGLRYLLGHVITNFIDFPGLGNIFVMVMAVNVAMGSGFLEAGVRWLLSRVPGWGVPYAVAFVAAQGHVFSDASYFVIAPLGAVAFKATGRNPLAGLIGAYACLQGGYAGGFVIGTLDATYIAITDAAVQLVPGLPPVDVHIAMNYFFTAAVGVIFPLVGGWLIAHVLEPRLPSREEEPAEHVELAADQRRGLVVALTAASAFLVLLALGALVPGGPFHGSDGTLLSSPLLENLVAVIGVAFVLVGVVFGLVAGTLTKENSLQVLMTRGMRDIAGPTVVVFVIAQVFGILTWSNLGSVLAIGLADLAKSSHVDGFLALLLMVCVSATLNMVITGGGALWSLVGPVMVPSLMLLGLSPAVIQAAHRIGDSTTTLITPMSVFLIVLLSMAREYEPGLRLGTLMTRLAIFVVPYFAVWLGVLGIFYFFDLPLGPGAGVELGAR
ncbi:AbgT family transporter [Saccharopolyspora sp. WRP15-2]|uniref:AbgT family transporter n=1 Tax=Saccharopolyspora oryzae TaxID=2997343 RepID=A0ABT4UUU2_9PSEU|nr:AbgT family transporter [Saccharopolyspora oryzae]MDA3625492.1 AbgT family transporter [Saccharopolyspora oryzae]